MLLPQLEMLAGDMAQLVERLPGRLEKSWKVHKRSLVAVRCVAQRGTTNLKELYVSSTKLSEKIM